MSGTGNKYSSQTEAQRVWVIYELLREYERRMFEAEATVGSLQRRVDALEAENAELSSERDNALAESCRRFLSSVESIRLPELEALATALTAKKEAQQ